MWLYVRDDFMLWFRSQGRNPATNERLEFRITVADAIEKMLKKMSVMSALNERKNVSARNLVRLFTDVGTLMRRLQAQLADGPSSMPTVTVVSAIQQLINFSTNPGSQARNTESSYPWF
jgi:hypothetical protein